MNIRGYRDLILRKNYEYIMDKIDTTVTNKEVFTKARVIVGHK